MAIQVYILKNTIVKSSVEEYIEFKASLKEQKKLAAKQQQQQQQQQQENPTEETPEMKLKKERRTVFLSTLDTAAEALSLAGISYEGDLNLDDIEFCKIESQQKCLSGTLDIPKLNDVLSDRFKVIFFLNRKNIVIIDNDGFAEKIIRRIMANRYKTGQSRERFLYSFCARFMERDLENLGKYGRRIMQMEEQIAHDDLDDITEKIAEIRQELLVLREYYDELHDFGKQLEENENHFFSGKNLEYFGIISDRADRLMNRTMYFLDRVAQLRETYQGKLADQQNANMEFLTIISTIFFPLTLITGWYGMNFQNMPELAQGYPFVIGLSLVVIAVIILIFKKRKIL